MSSRKSDSISRLLLLDDDKQILEMLCGMLQGPGHQIIACSEIEAAECVVDQYPIHMVVTDLVVSELGGLEGMRLVRHVTTHFPDVPLVIYSGHADAQSNELGKLLGAREVFSKPGDLMQLQEYVRSHLPTSSSPSETPQSGGAVMRVELLESLLTSSGIKSVFQPIVRLRDGEPSFEAYGVESLARGPRGTLLADPETIFGYASRKDMLFETDMTCIRTTLREARDLPRQLRLFINVQPRSLSHSDFVEQINTLVSEEAFEPSRVIFELTEQHTIVNPEALASTLQELRASGFQVALDDYGEGVSNLDVLFTLRPDFIKISGFFAQDIHREPRKQSIVRTAVEMAKDLGMEVVAEHIEAREEMDVLRKLGVQFGQGYLFGRPAPCRNLDLMAPAGKPES